MIRMEIYNLHVKNTFLNRLLQEYVFVKQPESCIIAGAEDKFYKHKKAFNGLTQAF